MPAFNFMWCLLRKIYKKMSQLTDQLAAAEQSLKTEIANAGNRFEASLTKMQQTIDLLTQQLQANGALTDENKALTDAVTTEIASLQDDAKQLQGLDPNP